MDPKKASTPAISLPPSDPCAASHTSPERRSEPTSPGGRLEPGFDLFAHHAHLERRLRSADLVITAEGAIDRSTLMGKGAGQIAARCRKLKIPCLALAGLITPEARAHRIFQNLHALTDLTTVEQAMAKPAFWLNRLAEQAAQDPALSPSP